VEAETAPYLVVQYGIEATHLVIAEYDNNIQGVDAT